MASWLALFGRIDLRHPLWGSGLAVICVILAGVAAAFAVGVAARAIREVDPRLGPRVVALLGRPIAWLARFTTVGAFLDVLELPPPVHRVLAAANPVCLVAAGTWATLRALTLVGDAVRLRYDVGAADNLQARAVHTQVKAIGNILKFAVGLLGFALALMTFDSVRAIGLTLLASAGVASVVLGFAAQKTLGSVLAGLQIAVTQPFRVDDVVIVEHEWGRIEEIALTYVVVRIWDSRRLVVPITYFTEKPFENWTRTSADILGTVTVHADYDVDVPRVRDELRRLLETTDLWDRRAWSLEVTNATATTVELRALMSAADASRAWDLRCLIRERLVAFVSRELARSLPRVRAEVRSTP
ncbi:MAG TPA: mechanosensitive ion channel domain-containing protein [Polyangiaceae bacterium]|nr:mechanosensitive ion channel domain-containing protein [Polyangiaceae bacterium]